METNRYKTLPARPSAAITTIVAGALMILIALPYLVLGLAVTGFAILGNGSTPGLQGEMLNFVGRFETAERPTLGALGGLIAFGASWLLLLGVKVLRRRDWARAMALLTLFGLSVSFGAATYSSLTESQDQVALLVPTVHFGWVFLAFLLLLMPPTWKDFRQIRERLHPGLTVDHQFANVGPPPSSVVPKTDLAPPTSGDGE